MADNPHNILLITGFPNVKEQGFNWDEYNHQFKVNNTLIKSASSNISYPEHWGPLSLKTCLHGTENYQVGKRFYGVNENNFLILNQEQWYSSYIYSTENVDSFTLNFNPFTRQQVISSIIKTDEFNLDNPVVNTLKDGIIFTEKLNTKGHRITFLLEQLCHVSKNFSAQKQKAGELFILILEEMIFTELRIRREMEEADVIKTSTKTELYKRLHFAKDYIDSCYQNEITLHYLSQVANLNGAYLLRKFRKMFKITPHQYLIKKRMEAASVLLQTGHYSVTEVCNEVGYSDLSSFGKLFKQKYKCSPENFKKAHLQS